MNFDRLYAWALGIVIVAAAAGKLNDLEIWIWKSQARIIYESRTATWGTPRFWPETKNVGRSR
jgi:hypothetical protein